MADGLDNARMRPAAAYIALQKLNDVSRTGIRIRLQQAYAAHNHSGCAKSALECAGVKKRLLHGMQAAIFLEAFDGGDYFSGYRAHGNLARASRGSRDQNRASTTLPFPAAVLGPAQKEFIAQNGQEWRVGRVVDRITLAVDFDFDGHRLCPSWQKILRRFNVCGKCRKRFWIDSVRGNAGSRRRRIRKSASTTASDPQPV